MRSSRCACASRRARSRRPTRCARCARTSPAWRPSSARRTGRHPPPPEPPGAQEHQAMSTAIPSSRNTRKALIGFVRSRSGDKSIKVTIPYKTPHPLYHKVINRKTVVHAHDEKNETKVGDKVEIMETRPMSRLKRWRIISVVERTVGAAAEAISEKRSEEHTSELQSLRHLVCRLLLEKKST